MLPQNERGWNILRWGADHAWLAGPANPKRSVRRWCKKYAPWLTGAELDRIVLETETNNKRWTSDQSATTLEIGVRDREALELWFLGADDDPEHKLRNERKREKAAARARKYRAAHSSGRKRGRRALELSLEERETRKREQARKRQQRHRASRKKPSRCIIDIGSVTQLSVTPKAEDIYHSRVVRSMSSDPAADAAAAERAAQKP